MKIKKFENIDFDKEEDWEDQNLVTKVNYITTYRLGDVSASVLNDVARMMDNEPHNNGHVFVFYISDTDEVEYPRIQEYFKNCGFKTGDEIFIHSHW